MLGCRLADVRQFNKYSISVMLGVHIYVNPRMFTAAQ